MTNRGNCSKHDMPIVPMYLCEACEDEREPQLRAENERLRESLRRNLAQLDMWFGHHDHSPSMRSRTDGLCECGYCLIRHDIRETLEAGPEAS